MTGDVHVDPGAGEGGDGSAENPFASLDRARDAIRDAEGAGRVVLHGGTYRRESPLVLGPADGGTASEPVAYAAAAGEDPVVSGGRRIEGWRPVDQDVAGLPEAAAGNVFVADLPRVGEGAWTFSTLFDADGRLPRARTPRRIHLDRDEDAESETALHRELHVADDDPIGWSNEDDAELFCTPHYPWTVNYLPIESVDRDRRVVRTGLPSTYPLQEPWGWGDQSGFYRVENVFEGLDAPGRWVLDTDAEKLYLWPRDGDGPPRDIVAPATAELVRLAGDHDGREWVRHVRFEGIDFAHGDRMRWGENRTSLQHDWEQHDEGNALLRLRGAEDVSITDCRFRDAGGTGVRLDLHAVDCTVRNCELARLGGSGVVLDGFGPGSRDENHHNAVRANHVHDVGELWWHSAGVFVSQSGHAEIADNRVHDTPYTGIVVSGPRDYVFEGEGRPHEGTRTIRHDEVGDLPPEPPHILGVRHARHVTVEHNEVSKVMQRLGDGNGIYLSGTGESCVVRRNHVHDVTGTGTQSAIRMDDDQYHALTTENVVHRINGAGIVGKCVNGIHNNVVVGCYDTGGEGQAHVSVRHRGPSWGFGIRRNVLVQPDREDRIDLIEFTDLVGQSLVDDNCYFSHADPDIAREAVEGLRENGQGTRSIVADPGVERPDGSISIPADTPAREVGFRPFEEWGPRESVGPRDA